MDVSTSSIATLSIDCLVHICEFLSPKDVANFSLVCKHFNAASQTGNLWRRFSQARWAFCDVTQVSPGPLRWWRYYVARRKVERNLDKGRPTLDYKVKTLRGHASPVVSVVAITDVVNWEDPSPPKILSLSRDGTVKLWDALSGNVLWSLENNSSVVAITANACSSQIAVGLYDGSVTLWSLEDYTQLGLLPNPPQGSTIRALMYESLQLHDCLSLVLMCYSARGPSHESSTISIWKPDSIARPLVTLDTSGGTHMPAVSKDGTVLALNTNGGCTHVDIWDLNTAVQTMKHRSFRFDAINVYNPMRTITASIPLASLCSSYHLLITGDIAGNVSVLSPTDGQQLAVFLSHKKEVTDLCSDCCRLLSCSKDYSIRVYRWVWAETDAKTMPKLETLYTLLGGSIALKAHDGFWKVLCTPSSCIGVCGNDIKVYMFAFKNTSST